MAVTEQRYLFVDKSGNCFEDFQCTGDSDAECYYNNRIGALMEEHHQFTVGDMFAIRDDLIKAGFECGKDFYIKRVIKRV